MYHILADGGVLCAACGRGENGSLAGDQSILDPECPDDNQWRIIATERGGRGELRICDHCYHTIQS